MHVQGKEQSLAIFTFEGFNYINIGPRKGCVNTPDLPFLNRMSLRSDKNYIKSMLRAGSLNLKAEV